MSLDIIQGERQPWSITINRKASDGSLTPLDLTGNVEITVCFQTGPNLITKLRTASGVTVDSAILGKISGFLEIAETLGMPESTDGKTEVAVDFGGGDVQKSIILRSHTVTNKICD